MTDDGTENVVSITTAKKSTPPKITAAQERPLYPSPDAPLEVARKLYKKFHTNSGSTLVNHRGDWVRWNGQQWNEWDTAHLRSTVYQRLGEVDYDKPIRKCGEIVGYERTRWNPNKHKVANVLEALAAVGHLPAGTDAPAWIGEHTVDSPASQMIACTNGLLSLSTRTLIDHTPAFYNTVSVPFAYQADAPRPTSWLKFLASVWPDDAHSIALLQEWMGYIVSGSTALQKILFGVGPTRSGKGTIARVLRNLIGAGNVTGPTMASLGTNFGLAPLMGKSLAIVPDARINGPVHTIVERLLSISGEDVLTVDRKFREPWSGKLPTRIMVLSNEIPRFTDASGAIANRLLVLQMRNSFLGKEDRNLDALLAAELPGILNWALEGLDRLNKNSRFTVPSASNEAATMLMDLASPVSAFVRDCCDRDPKNNVERDRLYVTWKLWCEDNGHEAGSKATFGRNLAAVVPDLGSIQPRTAGSRIRCYTHIGIKGVPPVPYGETAGRAPSQGVQAAQGNMFHPESDGTREGVPHDTGNQQVKPPGTTGTGQPPLQPQLKYMRAPQRPDQHPYPETAASWLVKWIAANAGPGGWVKPGDVLAAGKVKGFTSHAIMKAKRLYVDPPIESSGNGRDSMWRIVRDEETA